MKEYKTPWYFRTITINILIFFSFITIGFTGLIAMLLVYFRNRNVVNEIDSMKNKYEEYYDNLEIDRQKDFKDKNNQLNEEINKAKDIQGKYQIKYDSLQEEFNSNYNEKAKLIEDEYDKRVNELYSFTENYLDANYIERRNNVLLEQLSYIPIEERFTLSAEYKEAMKAIEAKEKNVIKENDYVLGSLSNKKTEESKIEKLIVSGLNAIIDTEISQVSIKNFDSKKKKIATTVSFYNEGLQLIDSDLKINPKIIDLKNEKLELMLEYKGKVEEEKELLREAREKEKEEKKLNALLDKEIEKIEKEKKKLSSQKEVYFERMSNEQNEDLKKAILVEIEKLNTAELELNDSEKSLEEKRKMSGAGYVYIISNIGSLGENIYKIGMTRREEPLDRVKELGNASVPFLFDVHALIYSKNAYELENQLHNEFAHKRVNKVNKRKEFFNVTLDEIRNVILDKYNGAVDFIETPEAIEYRETLLIENNQ